MLDTLYTRLSDRIMTVSGVNDVDWYNNQIANPSGFEGYKNPCCYIEFEDVPLKSIGGRVQIGVQPFSVWVVHDLALHTRHSVGQKSNALAGLVLVRNVNAILYGYRTPVANDADDVHFSTIKRSSMTPIHAFKNTFIVRLNYFTVVKDFSAIVVPNTIPRPPDVITCSGA